MNKGDKEMTMKKFNIELQANIKVTFSDPKKAQAYFIDGEWNEYFFDFDSLQELAEFIGSNFVDERDRVLKGLCIVNPKDGSALKVERPHSYSWVETNGLRCSF